MKAPDFVLVKFCAADYFELIGGHFIEFCKKFRYRSL